jgi:putative FmdB family regulatory protein
MTVTHREINTLPTYDYVCLECGRQFDVRASISAYSAGLSPHCPDCGSDNADRRFSSVNVLTGSQESAGSPPNCGPSGFS